MNDFEGATLLITGGATGLGAATAELAAAAGARVAVADVNNEEGRATADRVGGQFFHLDVADVTAWPRVLDQVEANLGTIHFAHLNAGIMVQPLTRELMGYNLADVTPERYRSVLGVNVDGVFFGMQALLPRMTTAGAGAITVTSSMAGLVPIPFDPVYSLTKHALIGLVRSMALASLGDPVRINAICPGGFSSVLLPIEMRGPDTMTSQDMAEEVIDLLLRGETGETRVRRAKQAPAHRILPPELVIS